MEVRVSQTWWEALGGVCSATWIEFSALGLLLGLVGSAVRWTFGLEISRFDGTAGGWEGFISARLTGTLGHGYFTRVWKDRIYKKESEPWTKDALQHVRIASSKI